MSSNSSRDILSMPVPKAQSELDANHFRSTAHSNDDVCPQTANETDPPISPDAGTILSPTADKPLPGHMGATGNLAEANRAYEPYFAPSETRTNDQGTDTDKADLEALIEGRSFTEDLRRAELPAEKLLFVGWKEKLALALSMAYALYLHLMSEPAHVKTLLASPYFQPATGIRKRQISLEKLELIALQYVTQPATEDDRKSASTYSQMLHYAWKHQVRVEDFGERMRSVTLQQCRQFVRQSRGLSRKELPRPHTLNVHCSDAHGVKHILKLETSAQMSAETWNEVARQLVDSLNSTFSEISVN